MTPGPIGFRKVVGFNDSEDRFFFFWRSPEFRRKNRLNFSEDLFFGDHLNLAEKTA